MPVEVLMPALSPTMKKGTLAKWLVKEGEKVDAGRVIAEIETDKATMEFEASDEGTLGKILIPEKTPDVKVNEPIAILLEEGEGQKELQEFLSAGSKVPIPAEDSPKVLAEIREEKNTPALSQEASTQRVVATPLARKIASLNGIELSLVGSGSGPDRRIVKRDLEEFLSRQEAKHEKSCVDTKIPVSPMRRVIAERLLESKQTIPHFYLSVDCTVDQLLLARKKLNEALDVKITVNDFIVKASAFALRENPGMNTCWEGSFITQKQNIDISIAIAVPDGLITPIVFSADKLSLASISLTVKELVNKAKAGTLQPREFQGGSFTISNLGMYGIDAFTAIINPPQAAILAVGAAKKAPVVLGDTVVVRDVVNLTLSCDHRVIDGALAAQFMQSLKKAIEDPVVML